MSEVGRERWEQVEQLFQAALELEGDARERLLRERCGGDATLRREVLELLDAADGADSYFADLAPRAGAMFSLPDLFADLTSVRCGAYRLLRRLGQGGMAAVYLAERADGEFRMQAAVKLLPPLIGSPAMHSRFLVERQILASLDHPGIARLLDGGVTESGIPYFVMEYVEGEPIDHYCDARRLDLRGRLALFRQVCEAVRFAHERSVVHRDLKPSNILVTADGRVKLLDFGIAKVVEDGFAAESTLTQWGGSPLTPAYASPEQVSGEPVGFASDVYQLGVLLYHLLTGRSPYPVSSRTPAELKRVILEYEPPAPSRLVLGEPDPRATSSSPDAAGHARLRGSTPGALGARLRGGMDAVVGKALCKQPGQRYASVAALCDDVERWLGGRPVSARGERRWNRVRGIRVSRTRLAAGAAWSMLLAVLLAWSLTAEGRPGAAGGWLPGPFASQPAVPDAKADGASARTLVAHRFFEEGLRAYYQGRPSLAYPLFQAAVREDSTSAMTMLYLGHSAREAAERYTRIEQARRLAQDAPERERLRITARWADLNSDPSLRAVADSLVALWPDELDGHYLLGVARLREGDFAGAVPHFEHVVARDSGRFDQPGVRCRGCDALESLVDAYTLADSLDAAERAARRWIRLQPTSARPWERLAWVLWRQDRGAESLAARREAGKRRSADARDQVYPAVVAVREGRFASADALLADRVRYGTPRVQREALWWQTLSLRYQGRLEEALQSARRYRASFGDADTNGIAYWQSIAPEAQVLFEMGRFQQSARLLESAANRTFADFSPTRAARQRLWILTHAATARHAAGDTAGVRDLADTIRHLGERSGYGRDRRLHHYARGLLLASQGDSDAAMAAYRAAIYSPTGDFARPKLELARMLTVHGRADEAVAVLQPALRGPVAGGGHSATRTELHRLLGKAWQAAGRPDSAAAHFERVLRAWQHADPALHARRDGVAARRGALEARRAHATRSPM
jgi:serine/threonine protein kinase/tetratricopeptide (TPR) repeat protein